MKNLKRLFILSMVLTAVAAVAPAVLASAPSGAGPNDPAMVTGTWQTIPAASSVWFYFDYTPMNFETGKLEKVEVDLDTNHVGNIGLSIYTPDAAEASKQDDILWTFRQNSFIPHVRLEKASEPLIEPVIIFGRSDDEAIAQAEADVLILATADGIPAWFTRFDHVYDFAEVYDEARSQAARGRFAACKAAGYRMRFLKP
jgi:DNA polymerase-3 subunit chi